MEYPHGHNPHHRPHHDRREEEEYPPPARTHQPPFYGGDQPPPPFYGGDQPPPPFYGHNEPPPPQVHHTSHSGPGTDYYQAPPPPNMPNYAGHSYPQPPPPAVEDPYHRPSYPPVVDHHTKPTDELADMPTFRMYSKVETNYSLAVRDGKVILAKSNPSDPTQHWIKDQKYSTRVKDEEGFPSFALVNKATREAMKHSITTQRPVQLTPYNPNKVDESVLWTESKDLGDSYRAIRMVNNIRLNVDAFNGQKQHGGVHDGTDIYLWEWKKGDNQRWKIVPYWGNQVLDAGNSDTKKEKEH